MIIAAQWRRVIVMAICMTVIFAARGQTKDEYRLKSVFIFHFTHFVEWPETAFRDDDDPLVIGVLGDQEFGKTLEETVKGESSQGHPIGVKYFKDLSQVTKCHILYVGKLSDDRLGDVIRRIGKETLTVGDDKNFNSEGGMFRFYKESNKIRLSANKAAVDSSRLTVSSKLLRLAISPKDN